MVADLIRQMCSLINISDYFIESVKNTKEEIQRNLGVEKIVII